MEETEENKIQESKNEINQSNKKKYISINNYIENPFTKKRINSPRTLKAMENFDYIIDDIIYLSFSEFLDKYKDIKQLPEELQKKKYEFYEQYRQIKINIIKIERDKLIEELGENINIDNKIANIERKNIIRKLKKAEEELEKKILMKGKKKYDKQEKILERKQRREEKEAERQQKFKEENLKRIKQEEEYQKKEALKEKLKLEEKLKREKELEIKKQKFEEKVEKIRQDFIDKMDEKRKKMEERDEERKVENEIKKMKDMEIREIKNKKKQERIEQNKINLWHEMEQQREMYEMKKLEEKRRLEVLEKERFKKQMERELKQKQREENVKKVLANDAEIQEKKLEEYFKKQKKIAIKKEELQKLNEYEELERMERIMKLKMKRLNAQENNFKMTEAKKNQTEKKIKARANNVQQILKTKEKENLENIKKNQGKYEKVLNEHQNIIIMDKKKREEMALLLQKKSNKIDNFMQKKILENEKNNMNKERIHNKRREFELEFKSLFHDKKIDDDLSNKITEFFPNNNELINIVEKIKNLEHEEHMLKMKKRAKSNMQYEKRYGYKNKIKDKNKTKIEQKALKKKEEDKIKVNNYFLSTLNQDFNNNYNMNYISNNNNINENNYNEEKKFDQIEDKEILIMDQLNEFKIKLNKELVDMIELEEKKEQERIILYSNTPINKKEEIMASLNEERKKSNDLIQKLIENNEIKAKEYESLLRKKFS